MFGLEHDDASRREKCYTTLAQLPHFIDPKQPPVKRSPFSAILGHPFVHTVEVILPTETYSTIKSSLDSKLQKLNYARVIMTLSSLIEGEFFNTYVKSGNILMISEGQSGVGNVFTLENGVLRMELAKKDFEKSGLTGKPIRTGERKHGKETYLVEINLRLPSMLHGKKGFKRIEWAFKEVLNQPTVWLFFDLGTESNDVSGDDMVLKANNPQVMTCQPVQTTYENINTPSFDDLKITDRSTDSDLQDCCSDISEWLAMISLGSHGVSADHSIDPYLSRYSAPEFGSTNKTDLVSLKWHGLIPPTWITQLFILLLRETPAQKPNRLAWFALSASALGRDAVEGKNGYTIMALPPVGTSTNAVDNSEDGKGGRHFICWEYVGVSVL